MLGPIDYIVIAYLVILFLLTAYFRRSGSSKLRTNLSYVFLSVACISTVVYFALFYLVLNYQKFFLLYFVTSVASLISASLIVYFKDKNEESKDI